MAIRKTQTQVQWAGANSISVASGAGQTSDAVAIADKAIAGSVTIKAKHSAAPVSGDEVRAYVLYTVGDPDADPEAADEYDTHQHALPVVLDLNTEDPAQKTVQIDTAATGLKIRVVNDGAAAVTVSAQYSEQTG